MTAITARFGPARPAAAREPVADEGHPRRWWILAVPGAVAFTAQLDLFIVNGAAHDRPFARGPGTPGPRRSSPVGWPRWLRPGLATAGRPPGDGAAQGRPLTAHRGAR